MKEVQGGITDANGNFDIEIFPGKYNITIEYIGFDKTTIIGKIDTRKYQSRKF